MPKKKSVEIESQYNEPPPFESRKILTSSSVDQLEKINAEPNVPSTPEQCTPASWITLQESLSLSGVAKTLAFHCTVEKSDNTALWLVLDSGHDTLYNEMNHQRIASALKQHFSSELVLHIRSGNICSETPALYLERQKKEKFRRAQEQIYADKNVQLMLSRFEALVDEDSIVPLEKTEEDSQTKAK